MDALHPLVAVGAGRGDEAVGVQLDRALARLVVDADEALLDPVLVHLAQRLVDRVGVRVDAVGHLLEHVLDRELELSLLSASLSSGRMKSYAPCTSTFLNPIMQSMIPMSVGIPGDSPLGGRRQAARARLAPQVPPARSSPQSRQPVTALSCMIFLIRSSSRSAMVSA